jgi:hypothetical protein
MVNLSILVICLAGAIGIVVLGMRWRRGRHRDEVEHQPVSEAFLESLGDALGLTYDRKLTLFGETIQLLRGNFDNLFVELEISRGDWTPYVRIAIEFPSHLGQNVGICKDNKEAVLNYLRRMREFEIGDERFDPRFLLFGHGADRLRSLLAETTRFQLLRLAERADSLRLTDDGLFVLMDRPSTTDEISGQLRKSIELAERFYRTAYILGPSTSSSDPSKYQQQPVEGIREAAGTETRSDDESGSPRADATGWRGVKE